MLSFLYRLMLSFSSISFFFVVYLIKSHECIGKISDSISYSIYILITIALAAVSILSSIFLPKEVITGGVKEIEIVDSSCAPIYLGYFFAALSVNDCTTVIWIGLILLGFAYLSHVFYYNPLFLLFGYRFYLVTVENGIKYIVISRNSIKNAKEVKFESLRRINDYTFVERCNR